MSLPTSTGRVGVALLKWAALTALGWVSYELATVALGPAGRPYLMHGATLGSLGLALMVLALGAWRGDREGNLR